MRLAGVSPRRMVAEVTLRHIRAELVKPKRYHFPIIDWVLVPIGVVIFAGLLVVMAMAALGLARLR